MTTRLIEHFIQIVEKIEFTANSFQRFAFVHLFADQYSLEIAIRKILSNIKN